MSAYWMHWIPSKGNCSATFAEQADGKAIRKQIFGQEAKIRITSKNTGQEAKNIMTYKNTEADIWSGSKNYNPKNPATSVESLLGY